MSDSKEIKPVDTNSQQIDAATLERVLLQGDLKGLTDEQRIGYYNTVCKTVGLNPTTKPFDYMTFQGKMLLYANKNCAEQLRKNYKLSVQIKSSERIGDIYVVTASATTPDGRIDESTGAVSIKGLQGEALANAYLKAETKAKRRVTLSICSLGMLDESEVGSVPEMAPINVTPQDEKPKPLPQEKKPETKKIDPRTAAYMDAGKRLMNEMSMTKEAALSYMLQATNKNDLREFTLDDFKRINLKIDEHLKAKETPIMGDAYEPPEPEEGSFDAFVIK